MNGVIVESPIECNSAQEFIDAISPLGSHFRQYPPKAPFLFRGHGKDSYKLVASALRSDRPLSKLTKYQCDSYEAQVLAEKGALIEFFMLADKRGLTLPDDSQQLRRLNDSFRDALSFRRYDFSNAHGMDATSLRTAQKRLSLLKQSRL